MNAAPNTTVSAELQAIAGFTQVNLLQPVGVVVEQRLAWWAPLALVGVVAVAALASTLWTGPTLQDLQQRASSSEAQAQQQTRRVQATAGQAGTPQAQTQALAAAIVEQERLLALLGGAAGTQAGPASGAAPTTQDFSALLEGLAQTRVDGLWLTQVRIDRRLQEVRIEGQTRNAQLVPGYIDELSRNPRFKGLLLATVEVARPADHGAAVPDPTRFKLVSAVAPAASAAHRTGP